MLQPEPEFYRMQDEGEKARNRKIGYFFRYLRPYKPQLAQIVVCMVLYMVLGLIFPFLTQSVVDVGIRNNNLNCRPDSHLAVYPDFYGHGGGLLA